MRVLVMTEVERAAIQALVTYAEHHRVDGPRLARMVEQVEPPVGDDPHYVVMIPMGYRCVFSIEAQPKLGWCRHLSVSLDTPGRYPNVPAMQMLATAFGFSAAFVRALTATRATIPGTVYTFAANGDLHAGVAFVEPLEGA